MDDLTKKQRHVYDVLTRFIRRSKYSPTFQELSELTGHCSKSTVHGLLSRLKGKGYVTWEESRPRTLRILK